MVNKHPSSPPTIGVFIGIFGNYQDALCNGIVQVAKEHHVNVIFFAGWALKDQIGFRRHWNTIYDLASPANLDGLIVFTAAIKHFVTTDELNQFFARYAALPTVSINQKVDNIASVTINSLTGVHQLMQHLIEVHNHRRIAFIRGPESFEDGENRFRAYRESLEKYGIPYDPDLVVSGTFMLEAGVNAVNVLLDERRVKFDAIVAANDSMAFGAWQELNQRGINVPNDVAIAGFDDVLEARSFSVPLTTVNAALNDQGRMAAKTLINAIQERGAMQSAVIETSLVVRESCGCLAVNTDSANTSETLTSATEMTLEQQQNNTLIAVQNLICPHFSSVTPESLEPLVSIFFAGLRGESTSQFLGYFSHLLQTTSAKLNRLQIEEGVIAKWLDVLSFLHGQMNPQHPEIVDTMNRLLHQAHVIVSKTIDRTHSDLRNWAETSMIIQSELVRDINTASEISQISELLAANLPKLGIRTSAMALYEHGKMERHSARLMMACYDGNRVELETEGRLFPTQEIIPTDILPRDKSPFFNLVPLFSRDIAYGYLLMERQEGNWSMYNTYMALAEQIGAALHGVLLQHEIKQANEDLKNHTIELAETNSQLDKARQEAEQANQVKSWFLAAMSHELRTPLNGIVNFTRFVADGMLGEINEKQADALRKAVASSKHLLALINDVLDISKIESGSLKLFVEDNVDISQDLREILATGQTLLDGKPVELRLEVADDLPKIRADRRRMKQVVLNIMSNACKFTEEGSIVVSACQQEQDLLITVKDTGPGIAPEDHETVFETFRQTETGIRKGGGTGLGMPISRRLTEAHGGTLWLESELGKGAAFYIRVPIKSLSLKPTLKESVNYAK